MKNRAARVCDTDRLPTPFGTRPLRPPEGSRGPVSAALGRKGRASQIGASQSVRGPPRWALLSHPTSLFKATCRSPASLSVSQSQQKRSPMSPFPRLDHCLEGQHLCDLIMCPCPEATVIWEVRGFPPALAAKSFEPQPWLGSSGFGIEDTAAQVRSSPAGPAPPLQGRVSRGPRAVSVWLAGSWNLLPPPGN